MSTPEMDLTVTTGTHDAWHVLAASGEIDLFTAPALRDAIAKAIDGGATEVAVDLREVRFMDSMGLGVLIGARRRATERSARFALVAVEGPVLRVLDVSGLSGIFDVVADPESLPA